MSKLADTHLVGAALATLMDYIVNFIVALPSQRIQAAGGPLDIIFAAAEYDTLLNYITTWLLSQDNSWAFRSTQFVISKQFQEDWPPPLVFWFETLEQTATLNQNAHPKRRRTIVSHRIRG